MGLTPNQVTAISGMFTYAAIALLATVRPSWITSVIVALMLLVGYALDSADGQLARLTNLGRPSGEWLDHVLDMGKICLLFGAVSFSWARFGIPGVADPQWEFAVPPLFLGVSVVAFFGWLLSDLLIRIRRAQIGIPPPPASAIPAPALRSLLRLPSDYGLLALTFAWFSTSAFLVTLTLLLIANAAILAAALPVWFSQVRRSEEAS
jgi:phosphatidylglycerophosphate synthase